VKPRPGNGGGAGTKGVAVVTGASSGIGEATARRLDRDGWSLLLVARRAERLERLAGELRDASYLAVDLTDDDAPARVREAVESRHGGKLDLLVNNAGASRRAAFGDQEKGGYANVREIMSLNFDAVLRLTEALLPLLRASAPASIVNVASVAGRIANARGGAYSASKFALIGWTEAFFHEEKHNGVHVGMVLPGFISTEGFPQSDVKAKKATAWMVKTPDKVADAIVEAANGKPEVTVPKFPYRAITSLRAVAPGLVLGLAGRVRR
jgi:short-subunit dehydrogenase